MADNAREIGQKDLFESPNNRGSLALPPVPQPHAVQSEALQALEATRLAGNKAGLIVLATGLGKTWLSAFDSNRPEYRRVLFVAHREEILNQAKETYQRIRPTAKLGLYAGSEKNLDADIVFASIQTLGRREHLSKFTPDAFDYVIVDEFHHASTDSYRRLLDYFTPTFLLGMTATPERTDGGDLLALCQENLVYRCDLAEGIRRDLLCPFHYFGVPDEVDYRNIPWRNARFDEQALTTALATEARAHNALEQYRKHAGRRTLAFCCSQLHADFMAEFFQQHGLRAVAVHSGPGSAPRKTSLEQLTFGKLDILCAVDVFNEGVDLPLVDTVMMLRPTESTIVWLQQFGRGLRKSEAKGQLRVIDYVGNHRSFLSKLPFLFDSDKGPEGIARLLDQVRNKRVTLPPGCEVTYDLVAMDILRSLLPTHSTQLAMAEAYYDEFKERHGRRPLAVEAFHDGFNSRRIRQHQGPWLVYVGRKGDLNPGRQAVVQKFGEFLTILERTPMTRCFKMLTLLAMLQRDALPGCIDMGQLTAGFGHLADRSAALRADVAVPLHDTSALRKYLEKNPVAAWTKGKGTGGAAYFTYQAGVFKSTLEVPADLRTDFQELVREIVDWRLAEYLQRSVKQTA
jgi:superfamily II DNA or RNA helicase